MTDVPPYGAPPPPPWASQPPPQYGAPPPYGYQYPSYGYAPMGYGPPGQTRSTGLSILLFFVTFGIYGYVYNFMVHDEMKRHSGRGIGGGIALLLTFLAGIAMPFVTPAEVGSLYRLRGQPEPVSGWTGLWVVAPAIGSYIASFILLFSTLTFVGNNNVNGNTTVTTTGGVTLAIGLVVVFAIVLTGAITWFVKTNNALNRYWESLGVPAA